MDSQELKEEKKILDEFVPQFIEHSKNEMYRYNMDDLVVMLDSFHELWDRNLLKNKQLGQVHEICNQYLANYLHKSQQHITGNQLALLVTHMHTAHKNKVYEYDQRTW
eukprot:CAMPEP_0116871840 /NCGR_PEP_ID=MMETSP0463-20121206/2358_1 /TAXON_ID=181622 /ORGANISM="Strombidinopsis sp, Strain SopsisLIS2011" /LENGTH=107 /DNA_ID=CAMNT_0004510999 /DNA_START=106 /DNA_END=429 /DNA_ORIENTATION=+